MRISDWSSDVCSSDLLARLTELADFRKGDKIRARIDDVVTNQQAAEGLKPWYGMLCKRPNFHDDYLQAFNQPNMKLVDTQVRGVDRHTATGIGFAVVEEHVTCIILDTGLESVTKTTESSEQEIRGEH